VLETVIVDSNLWGFGLCLFHNRDILIFIGNQATLFEQVGFALNDVAVFSHKRGMAGRGVLLEVGCMVDCVVEVYLWLWCRGLSRDVWGDGIANVLQSGGDWTTGLFWLRLRPRRVVGKTDTSFFSGVLHRQ